MAGNKHRSMQPNQRQRGNSKMWKGFWTAAIIPDAGQLLQAKQQLDDAGQTRDKEGPLAGPLSSGQHSAVASQLFVAGRWAPPPVSGVAIFANTLPTVPTLRCSSRSLCLVPVPDQVPVEQRATTGQECHLSATCNGREDEFMRQSHPYYRLSRPRLWQRWLLLLLLPLQCTAAAAAPRSDSGWSPALASPPAPLNRCTAARHNSA